MPDIIVRTERSSFEELNYTQKRAFTDQLADAAFQLDRSGVGPGEVLTSLANGYGEWSATRIVLKFVGTMLSIVGPQITLALLVGGSISLLRHAYQIGDDLFGRIKQFFGAIANIAGAAVPGVGVTNVALRAAGLRDGLASDAADERAPRELNAAIPEILLAAIPSWVIKIVDQVISPGRGVGPTAQGPAPSAGSSFAGVLPAGTPTITPGGGGGGWVPTIASAAQGVVDLLRGLGGMVNVGTASHPVSVPQAAAQGPLGGIVAGIVQAGSRLGQILGGVFNDQAFDQEEARKLRLHIANLRNKAYVEGRKQGLTPQQIDAIIANAGAPYKAVIADGSQDSVIWDGDPFNNGVSGL